MAFDTYGAMHYHGSMRLAYAPKTLSDRWHSCPHCGLELDENSGQHMLERAEGALKEAILGCHPVLKARWDDRSTEQPNLRREASPLWILLYG
jgi:hypothetical protein